MGKSRIILLALFLFLITLSACGKQDLEIDLANIDISEIEKIEHTGTTGGKDGEFSLVFTESEVKGFIDLLNQVELGHAVDEKEALSKGARP